MNQKYNAEYDALIAEISASKLFTIESEKMLASLCLCDPRNIAKSRELIEYAKMHGSELEPTPATINIDDWIIRRRVKLSFAIRMGHVFDARVSKKFWFY